MGDELDLDGIERMVSRLRDAEIEPDVLSCAEIESLVAIARRAQEAELRGVRKGLESAEGAADAELEALSRGSNTYAEFAALAVQRVINDIRALDASTIASTRPQEPGEQKP